MVAAKTDAAHRGLTALFAARDIERAYWALVWGLPSPPQGTVTGNIGRSPRNRQKMAVLRHGGRPAETAYKVLRSFRSEEHTSEIQSLMSISYAVFCSKKKT